METANEREVKHYAIPTKKTILKLCNNDKFKHQLVRLREKWHIDKMFESFDKSHEFWRSLCEEASKDSDYIQNWYEGKTPCQKLEQELQTLCRRFQLPSTTWITLYNIMLCIDLENIKEADILELPVDPSMFRVHTVEYSESSRQRFQEHHYYLDVTYASKADVDEMWNDVKRWQTNRRKNYIKHGLLPDFLQDIKPGPVQIPDAICIECANLKDQGLTYPKIGRRYNWPRQVSALNKDGKETRSRCRTAEEAVKRGRELRRQ